MHQVAVKPRFVACPVAQLVKSRRVVVVCGRELALVGQVDAVGRRPIEGAVLLAMFDDSARRLQDLLGALHGVPVLLPARLQCGKSVDLLGIEHRGEEHPGTFQLDGLLDRLALGV